MGVCLEGFGSFEQWLDRKNGGTCVFLSRVIPKPDMFFFHKKIGLAVGRVESRERFVSAFHVLCTPARLF